MRIGWAAVVLCGCTALFDLQSAPNADRDNDTVVDSEDNCPDAFNRDQSDKDKDGLGDACDECLVGEGTGDADGDGILDDCDECDNRDADDDNDGVPNNCDQCANINQDDDGDGIDDGCDVCIEAHNDADKDGIDDACDPCPNSSGVDNDADGVDDACDMCQGPQHDEDGDGFLDSCVRGAYGNGSMAFDNCPIVPNPDQLNTEEPNIAIDDVGNACDGDPMVNAQVFDGFVKQDPAWSIYGAGWTTVNDVARLLPTQGSFRSLPTALAGDVRVYSSIRVGTTVEGSIAEVFVVNGGSWPIPPAVSARCQLGAGQLTVVVYEGDKTFIDMAQGAVPGSPVLVELRLGKDGSVECFASTGLFGAYVQSTGALDVTGTKAFKIGLGGANINAEFEYIDAIGTSR